MVLAQCMFSLQTVSVAVMPQCIYAMPNRSNMVIRFSDTQFSLKTVRRGPKHFLCRKLHDLNLGTNVVSQLYADPVLLERGCDRNLPESFQGCAICNACKRLRCGHNT